MDTTSWLVATSLAWFIYSTLTIYGAIKFPIYSNFEKVKSIMLVIFIPFIGSYVVNHNMGYRFNQESKRDLKFELPWWVSIGVNSKSSSLDDD